MANGLNILVINWQDITNPDGGGAEVHLHEIFKRVAAKGHRVTLLCCSYPGAEQEETLDGIRIVRKGSRGLFNFFVPFMYNKLRKEIPIDVVVDDINKIPFYTPLYVKEPILALEHHLFGKSIFMQAPLIPAAYVYYSEKLVPVVYRHTPFAVVSESTRQELLGDGVLAEISMLYNAVDHDDYLHDERLRSTTPLVGYFGRLKKYKCVEHFIRAIPAVIESVPDANFVIMGGGDDSPRLEQLVNQLGIANRVTFTGYVSDRDKVEWLNRMWFAVNPSPKEGWGLTVIEANACGTPVIAADSPGLRDSVVDGETGILYPFGQINILEEKMIFLLQNEKIRNKLSKNSLNWALEFNWDESANQAVRIMESCKKNRNGEL